MSLHRVNVGCGATPTHGWINYDNSVTVRVARVPGLVRLLARAGLVNPEQRRFADVAAREGIRWANAAAHIPLPDGSVGVLYSSHMLEHLDRGEARVFLAEIRRVLAKGGILRLALPDLAVHVREYLASGDADAFVAATLLAQPKPKWAKGRLRQLVLGNRDHHWMYDGPSLCRLLEANGFERPEVLPPGRTTIPDPGPLDLAERVEESVYVEAQRA